jgi:hypothetical protein
VDLPHDLLDRSLAPIEDGTQLDGGGSIMTTASEISEVFGAAARYFRLLFIS